MHARKMFVCGGGGAAVSRVLFLFASKCAVDCVQQLGLYGT